MTTTTTEASQAATSGVKLRKNVTTLTGVDLASLRAALTAMEASPTIADISTGRVSTDYRSLATAFTATLPECLATFRDTTSLDISTIC